MNRNARFLVLWTENVSTAKANEKNHDVGIRYWPCSRRAKISEENKVSRQISRQISRRWQNVTSVLITEYDRTIKAGWRKTCIGKGGLEISFTGKIEEIDEIVLREVNQRSGRWAWNRNSMFHNFENHTQTMLFLERGS